MNKIFLKVLSDDELYKLFDAIIKEMNHRKDKEVLEQQKAVKNAKTVKI